MHSGHRYSIFAIHPADIGKCQPFIELGDSIFKNNQITRGSGKSASCSGINTMLIANTGHTLLSLN